MPVYRQPEVESESSVAGAKQCEFQARGDWFSIEKNRKR